MIEQTQLANTLVGAAPQPVETGEAERQGSYTFGASSTECYDALPLIFQFAVKGKGGAISYRVCNCPTIRASRM